MKRKRSGIVLLILLAAVSPATAAQGDSPAPVVLMTYNILHSLNPLPPGNWSHRRPLVWETIHRHHPDVLAMQEVLRGQLEDFAREFGGEYEWAARGHDGGSGGEHLPVAWRKDRFELVARKFFWLSPTPEEPGSHGWGGIFPRIVTVVRLREKATGRELVVFNNHWEADNDLMQARQESARMLLERAARIPAGVAVFLCGDFNIVPARLKRRAPYAMLTENESPPTFTDAWLATPDKSGPDTTTNRLHPAPELQQGERKDWILFRGPVQPRRITVDEFNRDKLYPSDHLPVILEFDWSVPDTP